MCGGLWLLPQPLPHGERSTSWGGAGDGYDTSIEILWGLGESD